MLAVIMFLMYVRLRPGESCMHVRVRGVYAQGPNREIFIRFFERSLALSFDP